MSQLETNDVFKGGYLLSRSYRLRETRFVDNHQIRFVFEGGDILNEDQRYHAGLTTAEPLRLKECVNYLRRILNEALHTHKPRKANGKDIQRRSAKS